MNDERKAVPIEAVIAKTITVLATGHLFGYLFGSYTSVAFLGGLLLGVAMQSQIPPRRLEANIGNCARRPRAWNCTFANALTCPT
jgi:hypothetical protein